MRERVHYTFSPASIFELQTKLNFNTMKQELKNELAKNLKKLPKEKMSAQLGSVPYMAGDTITLTGVTDTIDTNLIGRDGKRVKYLAFQTSDGEWLAASQLIRRRNGLNIQATVFEDAVMELADRIDDEEGYSFIVDAVKKIESSYGEGKSTYLTFIDIDRTEEAPEEEAEAEEQ